jgi:hypothetical protein
MPCNSTKGGASVGPVFSTWVEPYAVRMSECSSLVGQ